MSTASSERSNPSSEIEFGSVGYKFRKYFPGHGWYEGKVIQLRPGAAYGRDRRCLYSDGDTEDLSLSEIRKLDRVDPEKKNGKKAKGKRVHALLSPGNVRIEGKSRDNTKSNDQMVWTEECNVGNQQSDSSGSSSIMAEAAADDSHMSKLFSDPHHERNKHFLPVPTSSNDGVNSRDDLKKISESQSIVNNNKAVSTPREWNEGKCKMSKPTKTKTVAGRSSHEEAGTNIADNFRHESELPCASAEFDPLTNAGNSKPHKELLEKSPHASIRKSNRVPKPTRKLLLEDFYIEQLQKEFRKSYQNAEGDNMADPPLKNKTRSKDNMDKIADSETKHANNMASFPNPSKSNDDIGFEFDQVMNQEYTDVLHNDKHPKELPDTISCPRTAIPSTTFDDNGKSTKPAKNPSFPVRKSSRDMRPTRKLEEYFIEQIHTSTKKRSGEAKQAPVVKKSKLLASLDTVPICKAAESTLCPRDLPEMRDSNEITNKKRKEENELQWFSKVASLLGTDTANQRGKRAASRNMSRAPSSSSDGLQDESRAETDARGRRTSDGASICSTISCSSEKGGSKLLSDAKTGNEERSSSPPADVHISKSASSFVELKEFAPGSRHGLKVIHKKDKMISGEVLLEKNKGAVEVIVRNSLKSYRVCSLLVVQSDRVQVGEKILSIGATESEAEQPEIDFDSSPGKKSNSKPCNDEGTPPMKEKKVTSQNRRTAETSISLESLFYWHCESCHNRSNKYFDQMCTSCNSMKTQSCDRSTLLEIAENSVQNANTLEEAIGQLNDIDKNSIPEKVLCDLLAIRMPGKKFFAEFCVQPSTDIDEYFYWICGKCTMRNSFRKNKCFTCLQVKGQGILAENSPMLRIAEEAALKSKTVEEAFSLVPIKTKGSIPEIVMESLVTCIAMAGRKGELRRCRKPKLPGFDFCVHHCDPILFQTSETASATPTGDDSNSHLSLPTDNGAASGAISRGIPAILNEMPPFLESKTDSIMVNELRWFINGIEDSVLCEESKPFPLGLKVRKWWRGYGFHDGRIVKVCRKYIQQNEKTQRPVLVYRVRYNDGDEEDLLNHEISSLRQVYDICNVSPESPPQLQIPNGTQYELQSGNIIKIVDHKKTQLNSNPNELLVVQVADGSTSLIEVELLKLQLTVLRKLPPVLPAEGASTSVPCASTLEWPGRGRSLSSLPSLADDMSVGMDETLPVCRGLNLRRKCQSLGPNQDFGTFVFSSNVDHPDDCRPGHVNNSSFWDPANALPYLSWDPFSTVLCEICKIDKDDNQVVICDQCQNGFHSYCVRPVMVTIPKDNWLCSKCLGSLATTPFVEYSKALQNGLQEVTNFLKLPYSEPSNFFDVHAEAITLFESQSKRQMHSQHTKGVVFDVGSLYFARRLEKHDWRLPTPLLTRQDYTTSVVSFVAAMKYCGMSAFSDVLQYPATGNVTEAMNNSSLDLENISPISKRNIELFRAFKSNMKHGAFPPVRVVHDTNFGFSVEAMAMMPRHTLIGEYVGEIKTMDQSDDTRSDSLMVLLNTGKSETSLVIDPTKSGNIARFLSGINNRSLASRRKVNVRTLRFALEGQVHVALFTSRKIEPGEKLQYDYNAGVIGKSVEELTQLGFYDTSNFF